MPGIVVGVDGSGHSQRALEWAMKEAAVRAVPLIVLTVHALMKGYYGSLVELPDDPGRAEKALLLVQAEVDKCLDEFGDTRAADVVVRAVAGSVVEELVKAGKDADLLVVGSRGAGGFARLMMGSVSALVIHHATCPVVVIPPEGRE
jgi:nucleotide-binding universal stress UspA family protein